MNSMMIMRKNQSIWLASAPIDFRKSIDGLCAIVQEQFEMLPHEGIFIFYNTARNRIKILLWHNNGFLLIYKRFETGKLFLKMTEDEKVSIKPDQLNWLILGVDWITLSSENTCEFKEYS